MSSLIHDFSFHDSWRERSAAAVERLRFWLVSNDVDDARTDLRLAHLLERLAEERMTVAFVAEFSRGKSELINAIFFADLGGRLLPSSAGRTTMCPTELCWPHGAHPEIRLLPIQSRATEETLSVLRAQKEQWLIEPLDPSSSESLVEAFARVSETLRVTQEEAEALGFRVDAHDDSALKPDVDGKVEISRWRHAIIHFPHPLLQKGLVVLDTPGLNAMGVEPELTLSMLPNAHAVVFVLAADTGVTRSDLAVWKECVSVGRGSGRGQMIVLNKIDGLWDGLRDEPSVDAEIAKQTVSVAQMLDVTAGNVYQLSAQKALVGRVQADPALVAKSRIEPFERALSEEILPAQRQIVRETTLSEVDAIAEQIRQLLEARAAAVAEQLQEIESLRGKNQGVIEYMMRKIAMEKQEFEEGLRKYHAVRSVFTSMTNNLLAHVGLNALRKENLHTREAMLESTFTSGLKEAMERYFSNLREKLTQSNAEITEITTMLGSMYKRFRIEHGLKLSQPETFSTQRYEREIDRLEERFKRQINSPLQLVVTEKHNLTQRFFDTVAVQARKTFELVNRDLDHWLRAVMAPLETQVREYQIQLKRRLESVKRIHQATDTLEDRLEELRQSERVVHAQLDELAALRAGVAAASGGEMTAGGTQGRACAA